MAGVQIVKIPFQIGEEFVAKLGIWSLAPHGRHLIDYVPEVVGHDGSRQALDIALMRITLPFRHRDPDRSRDKAVTDKLAFGRAH